MKLLQLVWQIISYVPENIAHLFRQRQRQVSLNRLEIERLDRIRNPSKYRGK